MRITAKIKMQEKVTRLTYSKVVLVLVHGHCREGVLQWHSFIGAHK